jgi:membrane-bound serine protease (ClpP class)
MMLTMNKHLNILRWAAATTLLVFCLVSHLAAQATLRPQPLPRPAAAAPVDAVEAGQPLQPPHLKAAMIRLHGEVDDMMLKSLQRRVDIARKAGCTLVVYEIDSPGGFVDSTLEICRITRRLRDEKLATVAWVHDTAYSGAAFIALACQQIVMTKEAVMGDCAPIVIVDGQLIPMPPTERDKRAAPLKRDLEESAKMNGYDPTLLFAMVDREIRIHEMRSDAGETRFVDTKGKDELLAQVITKPDGTKLHPWRFVTTVEPPLLTVGTEEALAMHLCRARIDTDLELRAALNIQGDLLVLDFSWAEIATVWLSQFWVRGMLFLMMLVLAYIEFAHPGVTLPGIGALICLVLLIGAPFLTGLAQVWEIALIVLGLSIIVLDLVVFGGIGLLAIPGFLLMLIGIIASFVPSEPGGGFIPHMQSTWDALTWGASSIAAALVLAIASFYFMSKYLRMTPGFRRIQLAPAGGAAPVMTDTVLDAAERSASDAVFVGAIGRAATLLRPAGKARFGEFLVDVITDGDFIPAGAEVEVLELSRFHIVVKARSNPPASPPSPGGPT